MIEKPGGTDSSGVGAAGFNHTACTSRDVVVHAASSKQIEMKRNARTHLRKHEFLDVGEGNLRVSPGRTSSSGGDVLFPSDLAIVQKTSTK